MTIKKALNALALTLIVVSPATANVPSQSMSSILLTTFDSNANTVIVDDSVALLFGWTDRQIAENAAKRDALSLDNVNSIFAPLSMNN